MTHVMKHEAVNHRLQLIVGVEVCRTQALFKVPVTTNLFYIPTNKLAAQFVHHRFSHTTYKKE